MYYQHRNAAELERVKDDYKITMASSAIEITELANISARPRK